MTDLSWIERVRFGPDGLVPVVAQDSETGTVLMVAWATSEALRETARTGDAHYFSRSRQRLWRKGESSGHRQAVQEIRLDCDADTILYRVRPQGPACHTGAYSCFSEVVTPLVPPSDTPPTGHVLDRLAGVIAARAQARPEGSYTARLLERGLPKISQKVGEEAVEVIVAAHAEGDTEVASEAADLLYHLLVLLEARGVPLASVYHALDQRSH